MSSDVGQSFLEVKGTLNSTPIYYNYKEGEWTSSTPVGPRCPWFPESLDSSFWFFQLPNLLLLLAFLCCNTPCGVLLLRSLCALGCGLFAAWSWLLWCRLDWFIWNAVFALVNLIHLFVLCYKLRPVKFSSDLDMVYKAMFAPLRVSRTQFKKVTEAVAGTQFVPANHAFVDENKTRVENLTLVLHGSFAVSQGNRRLHVVRALQFLDSPEWFLVATDHAFQVTMTSLEDSTVIMWHRDRLKLSIMRDQFLQAVFDHILGRDVVRKLLQVSDTMSTATMLRCEKRSASSIGDGELGKATNGVLDLSGGDGPVVNRTNKPVVVVHREDKPGSESVTNQLYDPNRTTGSARRHEEEPLIQPKLERYGNDEFALAMEGLFQAIGRDSLAANFRPFIQHDVIRTTSL